MSALICRPLPFTVISGNAVAGNPISNLGIEPPAMVWISGSAGSVSFLVRGNGHPVDTIALVGTNLDQTDRITIGMGDTADAANAATSASIQASPSEVDPAITGKTVLKLDAPVAFNFLRVTITNGTNKAVVAQQLVVGRSVTTLGTDYGAKAGYLDYSESVTLRGYVYFTQNMTVPTYKATFSYNKDSVWRTRWQGLLASVGNRLPVLFVPDLENQHPHDIIFGRIEGQAAGEANGYNAWKVECNFVGLSL